MGLKALNYYAAFTVPAIFGFATFSALTHLISPVEYAVYSTATNFSYFAGSVFFSWIVFSTARYEAEAKGPVAVRFWLTCLTGVIPVALIVLLSISFFGLAPLPTLMSVLILCTSQSLFNLTQEFFRARHQSQAFLGFNLLRSILGIAGIIPLAYIFRDGHVLLAGLSGSFLIAAIASLALRPPTADSTLIRAYDLRTVISYGAGLAASGLVFASIGVITRLMVAHILGLDSAGPYNASLDLAGQLAGIVAMSVSSVISPTIIKSHAEGDTSRVIDDFRRGAELLLAAVAPTTIGLMLVAAPLAEVFTGPAFQPTVSALLPWVVASVAIWNVNHYYIHIAFQIVSMPFLQAFAGCIQVMLLVALSYPLIRANGVLGGAQAMLLANLATMVVTVFMARRVFPIPFPAIATAKVAACTVVMAGAVLAVAPLFASPMTKLAAQVIAGAAAYLIAALALDLCGFRSAILRRQSWRFAVAIQPQSDADA